MLPQIICCCLCQLGKGEGVCRVRRMVDTPLHTCSGRFSPSTLIYLRSAAHGFSTLGYLWCIRRYLGLKSAKLLVHALVFSRLDYCRLVLSGIAGKDLTKHPRVLNRLACVVTKSPLCTLSAASEGNTAVETAVFPSLVAGKIYNRFQKLFVYLRNTLQKKTTRLFAYHVCHVTTIPFIEIPRRPGLQSRGSGSEFTLCVTLLG